jgi:hypothetical protein
LRRAWTTGFESVDDCRESGGGLLREATEAGGFARQLRSEAAAADRSASDANGGGLDAGVTRLCSIASCSNVCSAEVSCGGENNDWLPNTEDGVLTLGVSGGAYSDSVLTCGADGRSPNRSSKPLLLCISSAKAE